MLDSGTGLLGRAVPLFGRAEVAEEVLRALQETRSQGSGRLLLLLGQGGIGKSTVLRAITATASSQGYSVLVGRCLPVETPRPFGLVEDLLRSAQGVGRDRSRAGPTPTLPLYASVLESGPDDPAGPPASGFRDPVHTESEADHLLEVLANPVERIDADRSSLFGRLTDFLRALARDTPLFVGIDDVPFADESSLEFLRQLAAVLGETRIVVVATSQPLAEAPPRRSPSSRSSRPAPGRGACGCGR